MIWQKEIQLPPLKRGIHAISWYIEKESENFPKTGMLNIFLKHTSAALIINENADPDVMHDMEKFLEKLVPENAAYFRHILEGSDDMPAHIKTALLSNSLNIPISNYKLNIGLWQGVFLCEFRNCGGGRNLVMTVF